MILNITLKRKLEAKSKRTTYVEGFFQTFTICLKGRVNFRVGFEYFNPKWTPKQTD